MIHLRALPGAPLHSISIAECEEIAVEDARALESGGATAAIIENFGDAPFRAHRVEAHTIAVMTRIARTIGKATSLQLGINVLRNDGLAALGIAQAVGATFIRVNILTGTMATDQGVISGEADRLMRLRKQLGAEHIAVMADVLVKHASPVAPTTMTSAVEDAVQRGLADAVIVSGSATGKPVDRNDVERATSAAGSIPVFVGSGATATALTDLIPPAYGAIIGTGLKLDGVVSNPVDVHRVREIAEFFRML